MPRRASPDKADPVAQGDEVLPPSMDDDEDLLTAAFPPQDTPGNAPVVSAIVPAQAHGMRLDQWLVTLAPEHSRNHLKQLVEQGCVRVGGSPVTAPARKVAVGQVVEVVLRPTAQSQSFVAQAMDLPIVFEDDELIVVDKPVGLVVHPAAGNWQGTLMNGLLAHHAGAVDLPRAGIVHRLDKDTSGLMVVGKTLRACTALTRAIAAREVHRQYQALVWGQPPASLRIDAPIGRDPVSRVRMTVLASGRAAMTDVRTIATAVAVADDGARAPSSVISAVECTLHTGRTHQIRVHLSSRRWPLVADALYGGVPALGMRRQALHAARLDLAHPVTGQPLTFRAGLPPDMAAAWSEVVHNGSASSV